MPGVNKVDEKKRRKNHWDDRGTPFDDGSDGTHRQIFAIGSLLFTYFVIINTIIVIAEEI